MGRVDSKPVVVYPKCMQSYKPWGTNFKGDILSSMNKVHHIKKPHSGSLLEEVPLSEKRTTKEEEVTSS